MANPWFRLYSEFANDPKVQMMSEPYQRRLVMFMCIRCNGHVTLHDDEVAFQLRISNQEWLETKAVFVAKKFIGEDNSVTNWDKRQYASDSSAARVAKHRSNKKKLCNVTVTPPDTDTDTDTEEKQDTANAVFVPVELGDDIKPESVPTKQIIAKYHEHLPMGTRVALWNEQRAKHLRARWRESKERQDVQWWNDFFEHCARSKFLTGQVESPGRDPFVISLDWILTPSKFTKIFEGLYHRENAK